MSSKVCASVASAPSPGSPSERHQRDIAPSSRAGDLADLITLSSWPAWRSPYDRPMPFTPGRPLAEAKADLFKALAHPARIRVLELLSESERTVGELADGTGL